ncbi:hypothetical protein ACERK3_14175 [Phycisphaerales bacterium AB-hyl4]|uniref:Uncharacterized protein n=1 Tax=Natronomicrosphaera hydrolytica TaxID=3242702 RepID=A0ABV4U756_9BACT
MRKDVLAYLPIHDQFELGVLLVSTGTLQELQRTGESPMNFFMRHARRDWGDIPDESARVNQETLARRGDPRYARRIISVYRSRRDTQLICVTEEHGRSTILLLETES